MEHNTKTLKFDRHYSVYHPEMVASFPPEIADKLLALGVAHEFSENPQTKLGKTRDIAAKLIKKG